MAMAIGPKNHRLLSGLLIGCLLVGCMHVTHVVAAEEAQEKAADATGDVASVNNESGTAMSEPLSLMEALNKGRRMLHDIDAYSRHLEEENEFASEKASNVYKKYKETYDLLDAALSADGEWDFKDEKETKDHLREAVIFTMAKALERKAGLDMDVNDTKSAKEAYKLMQQMLFSLGPIRTHKHDTKLEKAQNKAADLVQDNLDKGYFDEQIEAHKDNPDQITKNIEATIEEIVLKDLGEEFFEQKLFTKDEQYLYYKSNIQLAYIYSTRASIMKDQKAKNSLITMAEEQFQYATQYAHSDFMEMNLLRELGMHYMRHKQPLKLIEHFEKIIEMNNERAKIGDKIAEERLLKEKGIYSNLGAAYYATGNYSMALDALQKAAKAERNAQHVHFYMIRTHLKQGKPDEAFAYLDSIEADYGPQEQTTMLRQAIDKHLENMEKKTAEAAAAEDDKPVDDDEADKESR